jgi:hypothetical protein
MKTELYYYDIYPKVIATGKETEITIKPLGWQSAFTANKEYTLKICPLDDGRPRDYPHRQNKFEYQVIPAADGCIHFTFTFMKEEQYFIKIDGGDNNNIKLSVYAVDADLAGRYPFKGDLHMHTRRSDGNQAPEIVCAEYRKTGYDFFAITDHHRYYPSLDAIAAYKDVPIEFTIIPGEEIHTPNDHDNDRINDIHIVGFGGEYSINALISSSGHISDVGDDPVRRAIIPNPPRVRTQEEFWTEIEEYAKTLDIPEGIETYTYACCHWIFNEIRKANGLGIFCHPYWINDVLQVPVDFVNYMMEQRPFDAFEVLGGENYFEQNGLQTIQYYEDLAKGRVYPIVGSTDSHNAHPSNRNSRICSTIVFSRENERLSIIKSIKDMYSVAVDTISVEPRYVGSFRLVKYAAFLDQYFFPLHDELCFEEGRAMKDYVCGVDGAKEELAFLSGRMKKHRDKYFAF